MKRRPVMVDVFASPLYWTVLAASALVWLRGHNVPGGGFIGGQAGAGHDPRQRDHHHHERDHEHEQERLVHGTTP